MDFLVRIEESGFCQWVREADSLFAFPGILLLHTIGMGLVVGINATFDLRILGFAPAVRLRAIEKFFPVMWIGFWTNAITGTILLAVNVTKLTRNPDFYVIGPGCSAPRLDIGWPIAAGRSVTRETQPADGFAGLKTADEQTESARFRLAAEPGALRQHWIELTIARRCPNRPIRATAFSRS